jgi:hypothetical protein
MSTIIGISSVILVKTYTQEHIQELSHTHQQDWPFAKCTSRHVTYCENYYAGYNHRTHSCTRKHRLQRQQDITHAQYLPHLVTRMQTCNNYRSITTHTMLKPEHRHSSTGKRGWMRMVVFEGVYETVLTNVWEAGGMQLVKNPVLHLYGMRF